MKKIFEWFGNFQMFPLYNHMTRFNKSDLEPHYEVDVLTDTQALKKDWDSVGDDLASIMSPIKPTGPTEPCFHIVQEMNYDEKYKMYMNLEKSEIVKMLIECNNSLDELTKK